MKNPNNNAADKSKYPKLSKRDDRLISKIVQAFTDRSRKDIDKWREAIKQADDPRFPKRDKLHHLYADLEMDLHFISQQELRFLSAIGTPFKLTNKTSGEEEKAKTRLFQNPWFYDFLWYAESPITNGTAVLEVDDIENGQITGFSLIPRINVLPDFQEIRPNVYSNRGIPYNTEEQKPWIIEIKEKRKFGLLAAMAPQLIWKKNAQQAWAEFGQRFGQPYRSATTNSRDMKQIARIEAMLEKMGEAAYGIFPEGTTVDFREFNTADAFNVWDKQIERCNSEISKALNGATMMSDVGANGSRAQSVTHSETAGKITKADLMNLQFLINCKLIPLLNMHGYGLEDYEFQWDISEQLSLTDQWKMVNEAHDHYEFDEKWITQTFGFKIKGKKQSAENFHNALPEDRNPEGSIISGLKIPFPNYTVCECCGGHVNNNTLLNADSLNDLFLNAAKSVFKTHSNKAEQIKEKEWKKLHNAIGEQFLSGVEDGFGKKLVDVDFETPDGEMLQKLRDNVFIFSAFKNFHVLQGLNQLLTDENGKLREWNAYKKLALDLNQTYNVNYLQVEYNNAVSSSQMAAKWMRFEGKDDIYLQYHTVGDDRVRRDHMAIDGVIRPVDDNFWNWHFPPLGWGCRCDVDEVLKSSSKVTNLSKITLPEIIPAFQNNVGKTGVIFTDKHEYFKVDENDKKVLVKFAQDEIKQMKNAA